MTVVSLQPEIRMQPVLECRNLTITHGGWWRDIPAVINVDLSVAHGETVGILGEAKSGKSTLARGLINALGRNCRVEAGQRIIDGHPLDGGKLQRKRPVSSRTAVLIDDSPTRGLDRERRVWPQIIRRIIRHRPMKRREAGEMCAAILRDFQVAHPEKLLRSSGRDVSPADAVRLAIAAALAISPKIILLDAPTLGIDLTEQAEILSTLARIARHKAITLIHFSRDPGVIGTYCQRVLVLLGGVIIEQGTTDEVLLAPRHPYVMRMLRAYPHAFSNPDSRPIQPLNPRPQFASPSGCIYSLECPWVDHSRCTRSRVPLRTPDLRSPSHLVRCVRSEELRRQPIHGEIASLPAVPAERGDAVLVARKLSYEPEPGWRLPWRRHQPEELDELTFDLHEGECVGLLGESNSGTRIVARILRADVLATAGLLSISGKEIAYLPRKRRPAQMAQDIRLIPSPRRYAGLGPTTVAALIAREMGQHRNNGGRARRGKQVMDILARAKLPVDLAGRPFRSLSAEEQLRLEIALAYATEPRLVVATLAEERADAPFVMLAASLLSEAQRQHPRTALLAVGGHPSALAYIADRIIVLHRGAMVEDGLALQVLAPPYHPYTEALLAAVPFADPAFRNRSVRMTRNPSAISPPQKGCRFAARCPRRIGTICDSLRPPPRQAAPHHVIWCHRPLEDLANTGPVLEERSQQPLNLEGG